MDSIHTKVVNAPQMTKWDKVSYDMIDGSGSSNATFLRVLYLPKKAKVAKLVVATKTTLQGIAPLLLLN